MGLVEGADKDGEVTLGHPGPQGLKKALLQQDIHGCEKRGTQVRGWGGEGLGRGGWSMGCEGVYGM